MRLSRLLAQAGGDRLESGRSREENDIPLAQAGAAGGAAGGHPDALLAAASNRAQVRRVHGAHSGPAREVSGAECHAALR